LSDNPRDEYRWGIFPLLYGLCQKNQDVKSVLILGDLTDAKDRHPARLVNRVAENVAKLASLVNVYILAGNHDYVNEGDPFFAFLKYQRRVTVITAPRVLLVPGYGMSWFIPHQQNFPRVWKQFPKIRKMYVEGSAKPGKLRAVFMHQTVRGAKAETGSSLTGISQDLFKECALPIISGDVHVPQVCGKVTYVGSPYHVRFGDKFYPRILGGEAHLIPITTFDVFPKKWSITIPVARPRYSKKEAIPMPVQQAKDYLAKFDVQEGDLVKVTLKVAKSSLDWWQMVKEEVQEWADRWKLSVLQFHLDTTALHQDTERVRLGIRFENQPNLILERYCQDKKIDEKLANTALVLMEKDK